MSSGKIGESALAAGYANQESGYSVLKSANVQRAVADYRARLIDTEGANAAYKTLMDLMRDHQPPMVRLGAAKAMMSAAGIATAPADRSVDKPLNEMTEAELRAFMAKMDKVISDGGQAPVITVIPGDDAPQPGVIA